MTFSALRSDNAHRQQYQIPSINLCTFLFQQKGIEIWARPIMPVQKGKYSYGIVFLNRRTDGTPSEVREKINDDGGGGKKKRLRMQFDSRTSQFIFGRRKLSGISFERGRRKRRISRDRKRK
jgi:hypothetical protein